MQLYFNSAVREHYQLAFYIADLCLPIFIHQVRNYSPAPPVNNSIKVSVVVLHLLHLHIRHFVFRRAIHV